MISWLSYIGNKHRSLSAEKLFDRVACAHIFPRLPGRPPDCRARVVGFYFLDRTGVERRKAWAEAGGEHAGSEKKFTNDLIDRGYEKGPRRNTGQGFLGMRLKDTAHSTAYAEEEELPV